MGLLEKKFSVRISPLREFIGSLENLSRGLSISEKAEVAVEIVVSVLRLLNSDPLA